MTAWLLGGISGWLVLRLLGVRVRYPWQVVDLGTAGPRALRRGTDPAHEDRTTSSGHPFPVRRSHRGSRQVRAASGVFGVVDRGRRGSRRLQRVIEADLPAAVDLLHVAVTAGHSLHTALGAVARSGSGPVSREFAEIDRRLGRGGRLVEELDRLPERLGAVVRPLCTTLVVAASSGTPLGPTLQRLADAERRRLRRRTEERVRRLPVLLLGPLIGLVLPAFVLLTVVPVAITTARTGLQPATGNVAPADTATAGVTAGMTAGTAFASDTFDGDTGDLPPTSTDTFRSPP